jgi:hypothetical protein
MKSVAYFITPHGFGHATRACAVMAALQKRWPDLRCEIFTQVPRWLFAESLDGSFGYHEVTTDVGLAQHNALNIDLDGTLVHLDDLIPFSSGLIDALCRQVNAAGCEWIFCDIAALGVAVARAAGLPSVVVENFTWDWIYGGYVDLAPALQTFIDYLAQQFASADVHIQTEPVCRVGPAWWPVDHTVGPVARLQRTPSAQIRQHLDVPEQAQMVLVTMGGMQWTHNGLEQLGDLLPVHFVVTGGVAPESLPANVRLLAQESGFYHPDLVAASDAVVGKIGYSTLAEVYHAGVAYGYVPRERFRESDVLAEFVQTRMSGLSIPEERFLDGSWVECIPALLALPQRQSETMNGAMQIIEFIETLNPR